MVLTPKKTILANESRSNQPITYSVKKGDTLQLIAKRFQTTVEAIKEKNELKSNILTIGQTLYF